MAPCVRFGKREELHIICEPEIFLEKLEPQKYLDNNYLLSDLGEELIFSQGLGSAGTPFLLRLFFLIS